MAKDCPVCGVVNPQEAGLCDCGFNFERTEARLMAQGVEQDAARRVIEHIGRREARRRAKRNLIVGALWCTGGLIVTIATLHAAVSAGGGKYLIAWGAVVFGAIQMFRGLQQWPD